MNYSEDIKYGLERITALCAELGNPQDRLRCVHIAGTNGKGSTASLIAAGLQAGGLRVGLFTSPHLVDWRERIRINGEMIEPEYAAEWEQRHDEQIKRYQPSYFEYLTAMAFCYFAEREVDIAVIECGLGGRLDSTNIITPVLSVITSIGLDHTALLGDTRRQIAGEKAGIIKPNVPCIVAEYDDETAEAFEQRAREAGTTITYADRCEELRREQAKHIADCELQGDYQRINRQTAYCALRALQISDEDIASGYASVCRLTGLRGRWEILSQQPLTICDTGHNSHGIRTYVQQLKEMMPRYEHLRIVFGMVQDKDVDRVMDYLPKEAIYYWTAAQTERAIPASEMRQMGLRHGLMGAVYPTMADAKRAIGIDAEEDDIVFVGGSNYVVGEWLSNTEE